MSFIFLPCVLLVGVSQVLPCNGAKYHYSKNDEFPDMKFRVAALEGNLKHLTEVTTRSTDFNANLLSQKDVLKDTLVEQQLRSVDQKIANTGINERLLGQVKSTIAFTAYTDQDVSDSGFYQTIIFNKIILNEGKAYNPLTGLFTAPREGIYDFSFVVAQRHENELYARLFVNENDVLAACADAYHHYQDIQGGNRAFVRLAVGDVVRVAIDSGTDHLSGARNRFTSFSGLWVSN